MRRTWIYAAVFASPLVAAIIYVLRLGGFWNAYFFSVILGLAAFTWGCNQFVLACRPRALLKALGKKRLRRLHTSMPLAILVAAACHGLLKVGALVGSGDGERSGGVLSSLYYSLRWGQGFRRSNPQAMLGQAGWWMVLAGVLLTLLFVAPGPWMKISPIRRLRSLLFEKTGTGYRGFRKVHLFWAASISLLLLHILMASSTTFPSNPVGASWLLFYFLATFSVFLVSLLRRLGRHPARHIHALRARIGMAPRRDKTQ